MPGIAVGQAAPSFRLPSAQGPEIGLEDFRGKKNVVVWFTKGMACPFCRSHMSQLSRVDGDLQKLDTEVLEVSISGVSRARAYAKKFKLPFSYLCDPDYQVRRAWGLERRSQGIGQYVRGFVQGATAEKPPNDYGDFFPPLDEMRNLLTDDDMGFFIVDKRGVVRYALGGPYRQETGTGSPQARQLPSNDEIVREVAKCQASAGDASSATPS
jgi:peroxiredoxin